MSEGSGQLLFMSRLAKGARIGIALAVLAAVVAVTYFGARLTDQGVRGGIVGLELVGSTGGAERLIGDGTAPVTPGEAATVLSALLWDLLFIAVYSIGFAVAARLLVPLFRLRSVRSSGPTLARVALTVAALDVVENALLGVGVHREGDGWFLAATTCAWAKFLGLAALILTLLGALASGLTTPQWLYLRLDRDLRGDNRQAPPMRPRLGLALSGGGVRAASLSLGALQELERGDRPMGWAAADAVTAVSGGAYMGGAWQLGRDAAANPDSWRMGRHESDDPPLRDLGRPGPEEQHLLNNLGYLTSTYPRGRPEDPGAPATLAGEGSETLTDRMRVRPAVWATLLAGFVVNVAVISAALFVITIPLGLLLRWLAGLDGGCGGGGAGDFRAATALCFIRQPRTWVPPVVWLLVWLAVSVLWVAAAKVVRRRIALLGALKAGVQGSLGLGVALAGLLVGLPLLVALVASIDDPLTIVTGLLAAAGTIASVVRQLRTFVTSFAAQLGGIAFGLLLLIGIGAVVQTVWSADPAGTGVLWWLGWSGLTLFVAWLVFSPELWSMFAFYRGKLRSAYALRRTQSDPYPYEAQPYVNDADAADDPTLEAEPELGAYASKLTICAAANATTKGVRTHYRIPAMSFTFDSTSVQMFVPQDDQGDATVYRCTVDQLKRAYPGAGTSLTTRRITTMFAVALAGAAVSPGMGRFRIGPTSMLLAFTNIRLGAWLPNPRYVALGTEQGEAGNRFPLVRIGYLFKEFLGIHDPTDPFVYVSDGGHWENTGLVELLRGSMPSEAVLIDADAGRSTTVLQLTQAIDLAKLECDVDIFVDLEPLRGFAKEPGGPIFAQQSVTLGVMRHQDRWGLLWYSKPILTLDTPTPLLAHREVDSEFPATTTLDQFFDTSTYVAYRDLGRYNAAQIKRARTELVAMLTANESPDRCLSVLDDDDHRHHWAVRTFARLLRQQEGGGPDSPRDQLFTAVRAILLDADPEAIPPRRV